MSKTKLIIPCEEANHVCDKTQYKEASFWEKIILIIHLAYCKACRQYTANNAKLTQLFKRTNTEKLDPQTKAKMKSTLEKELANQEQN